MLTGTAARVFLWTALYPVKVAFTCVALSTSQVIIVCLVYSMISVVLICFGAFRIAELLCDLQSEPDGKTTSTNGLHSQICFCTAF